HARNERLDQIFFQLGGVADGIEVLFRIDEDQTVARAVPRRFCDQFAVFGESRLHIINWNAVRRHHARNRRKALRRYLVEGEIRRCRAGPREGNAAHFAHRLQFAILCPATVQAEHQQASLGLCPVERLLEPDAAIARPEFILERPRMIEQFFRRNVVHGVRNVPEPQIGFRQSLMQRLGARHRDETLLISASEKDCNPHQFRSIPIRLISQCSSIPEFSFTRARTVSPRVSISWPVAAPVLIKKLQCISDTCAPPTRKPRQPAASISFQALWPGGFWKVDPPVFSRIGCAVSRWFCTSFIRARIASGAAMIPRKRAEVKTSDGSRPLLR